MDELKTNVLYFGDNLEILRNREYFPDNSVDLIYLDPPFNSKKDYNILFKENGGVESEAQIKAFTDSWHWTQTAQDTYHEIVTKGPLKVGKLIDALHDAIGGNDVMAYLVMMTIRLMELHRVLKSTGSLYLHCDPTASHYLKLVLDQIFGPANFRNELIWKRTTAYADARQGSRHFGRVHDVLLRYTKTGKFIWNQQYTPYDQGYVDTYYKYVDEQGRRYWKDNLTAAKPGGDTRYEWKGKLPPPDRYWAYSKVNMERLEAEGKIVYSGTGMPMYKRYLDEMPGKPVQDMWDDIRGLGGLGANKPERLGYDTQKPLALLERIIKASSNEGDVVLDPFCGCGTAVVAAQKLNRRWLGIDITHLAINLVKNRLRDSFAIEAEEDGQPKDLAGARALAQKDRYNFQWWATDKIGARPVGNKKKGADQGIDGIITFQHDRKGTYKRVVVQVKSGHVGVNVVRELKTVAAKEAIGVLITLEPLTEPMKIEAITAGSYHSELYDKDYPKIQLLTMDELLQGKTVDMPPQTQTSVTFTKAQKITRKEGVQPAMGRLKFNMGDIVIGNDKKASFRDRKGTVIGYEPRTHEYLVRFDDGRNEYVNPSWLNHGG